MYKILERTGSREQRAKDQECESKIKVENGNEAVRVRQRHVRTLKCCLSKMDHSIATRKVENMGS